MVIRIHFKFRTRDGILRHAFAVTWPDRRQQVAAELQARGYHVLGRHGE
jgi:hypothetical protein